MIWLYNEQFIKDDELKISVKDHGFLYGVGLFETFRVYNNTPFLFKEHLERLQKGLKIIGINKKTDYPKMLRLLNDLLKANKLDNAYVRITVSAGIAPLGLPTEEYKEPAFIWQIKSLEPLEKDILSVKNATLLKTKYNSLGSNIGLKSISFLNNVIAKQEIKHLENTEGIFITNEGYIAEGIVSNIFFVRKKKLYTPSLKLGILNGITREYIIYLCEKNNIIYEEGFYKYKDIYDVDEIFISSSIQGIVPIKRFEKIDYKFNSYGITQLLNKEYKIAIRNSIIKNERGDMFET